MNKQHHGRFYSQADGRRQAELSERYRHADCAYLYHEWVPLLRITATSTVHQKNYDKADGQCQIFLWVGGSDTSFKEMFLLNSSLINPYGGRRG